MLTESCSIYLVTSEQIKQFRTYLSVDRPVLQVFTRAYAINTQT